VAPDLATAVAGSLVAPNPIRLSLSLTHTHTLSLSLTNLVHLSLTHTLSLRSGEGAMAGRVVVVLDLGGVHGGSSVVAAATMVVRERVWRRRGGGVGGLAAVGHDGRPVGPRCGVLLFYFFERSLTKALSSLGSCVSRGFNGALGIELFADPAVPSAMCRVFPLSRGCAERKPTCAESMRVSTKAAIPVVKDAHLHLHITSFVHKIQTKGACKSEGFLAVVRKRSRISRGRSWLPRAVGTEQGWRRGEVGHCWGARRSSGGGLPRPSPCLPEQI
jgi:hypothetical protein